MGKPPLAPQTHRLARARPSAGRLMILENQSFKNMGIG
jgi:hypothetical protein